MILPDHIRVAIKSGPIPKVRDWRLITNNEELTRAEVNMRFVEKHCRAPEGKLVGEPLVLDIFQEAFFYAVYDNPHITTDALLSIGRKNSKTATIAAIVLVHLVGPEAKRHQNSEILSGARSRDQAGQVYRYASKMVDFSPDLSAVIKKIPSKKRLVGLPMNIEYTASSAEAKTAHGGSPVVAILDELGQVDGPQDDYVDAIVTSQGAHEEPLLIGISTQAPTDADLLSVWIDDANTSGNMQSVCHLYETPKDADIGDESKWIYSNPAIGNFRSLEEMRRAAAKAQRMPSFENTFRNLYLNQRVTSTSPFVSRDVWMSCNAPPDYPHGRDVFVGLDLSARTDLTAAVVIAFDGECWDVWPLFWAPKKGLFDRAKRDRAPYDVWAKDGVLLTTPGASIDYGYVAVQLSQFLADCNILAVGFDRWRIDVFKKACADEGVEFPLIEYGQGYKDMAPAVDALEADLLNGAMRHGGHPLLTWCAANTVILKDPAGNRKLDKSKSTGRIDGMVALAMARGIAAKLEQEQPSVYTADRGIEAW